MKADFARYPDLSPYEQFFDAPEDSPERTIARYIELLSEGHLRGNYIAVFGEMGAHRFSIAHTKRDLAQFVDARLPPGTVENLNRLIIADFDEKQQQIATIWDSVREDRENRVRTRPISQPAPL